MHTLEHDGWEIAHHGDFSGNVIVFPPADHRPEVVIGARHGFYVPTSILLQLAAEYVRTEKISTLEQATTERLLLGSV